MTRTNNDSQSAMSGEAPVLMSSVSNQDELTDNNLVHDDRRPILTETTICSGKLSILAKTEEEPPEGILQSLSGASSVDYFPESRAHDDKKRIEAQTTNYSGNDTAKRVPEREENGERREARKGITAGDEKEPEPLVLSKKALHELEADVRKKVQHGVLYNFFSSVLASFLVFIFHLISLECLVSIALGVSFTVYTYRAKENNNYFNGSAVNWTLLSFAVITPMSVSLRLSFRRREAALRCFAELRSTFIELHLAHLCWDWRKPPGSKPTGRAASSVNWLEHSDGVLRDILEITDLLTRYLTLPNANRSRHRLLPPCRRDAAQLLALSAKFQDSIVHHMCYISDYCEILKQEGLPPNEASRIRQWERFIMEYVEELRMIKHYRTPQALRSFARLFSVLLPPLYAPYFADLARQVESLGFAIIFTIITSLALAGLFETIYQMEDPFEPVVARLDGVRVEEEFCYVYRKRFLIMREHYFKDAPPFSRKAIDDNDNADPK